MGERIEFASNGGTAGGYLVRPPSGSGPGVVVVQEWWGLDSGIKEMADRLGSAGFVALAPDLYHGELAGHDEMDKAAQLMTQLPPDRAARDMSARGRLPRRPRRGHGRRPRRGRLLHGRDALVPAGGRPARQDQGDRPVLRIPAGRHGARLVEAAGGRARAHGRERRLLRARRGTRARDQAARDWART